MKANLLLIRDTFTSNETIGCLYLNGYFIGYSIELPWKDNQKNISCIPRGIYEARIRKAQESSTKKYDHVLVKNVQNRSYILIHIANKAKELRGCIAIGVNKGSNSVWNSSKAFKVLMKELKQYTVIELIVKDR